MKQASKAVTAYLTGKDPERAVILPGDADDAVSDDAVSDDAEEAEIDEKVQQAASVLGASIDDEEVRTALRRVAKRKRAS